MNKVIHSMADINYTVYRDKVYGLWEYVKMHLTETARRKRTCHICKGSIKKNERHLAFYRHTYSFWAPRTNICVFCLEDLTKVMKKDIKGGIRNRRKERELDLFLQRL